MDSADAAIATNLRKGVVEFCVLALLGQEPSYGLALARRLQARGLISSDGTLYPLLVRLSGQGLVQSEWVTDDGPRPRKYYSLTPAGSARLEAFTRVWVPLRDAVDATVEEEP